MDVTHGMDPAAVEALGHRLQDHYAARVQEVANQLNSLIAQTSSQWVGPKGDLFRSWWPAKRAKLVAIAQDLHGFGQSALNNASEQRGASTAAHSGPGSNLGASPSPFFGQQGGWADPQLIARTVADRADDMGKAFELGILGLGIIPGIGRVPGWLASSEDWLAVRMLGTSITRSLGLGGNLSERLGGLSRWLRAETMAGGKLVNLRSGGAWGGIGLSALLGGTQVWLNQRDYGWGDANTIGAEIDGALGTAFSFVPGGGLVYSASRTAGDFLYDKVDDAFDGRISDNGFRYYAETAYHVTDLDQLTPSQIDEINQRYYGWSGLYHSTGDSIDAAVDDAVGAVGDAVGSVGGGAKAAWGWAKSLVD